MKKHYYRATINTINKSFAEWVKLNIVGTELIYYPNSVDIIWHTWSRVSLPKWLGKRLTQMVSRGWRRKYEKNLK